MLSLLPSAFSSGDCLSTPALESTVPSCFSGQYNRSVLLGIGGPRKVRKLPSVNLSLARKPWTLVCASVRGRIGKKRGRKMIRSYLKILSSLCMFVKWMTEDVILALSWHIVTLLISKICFNESSFNIFRHMRRMMLDPCVCVCVCVLVAQSCPTLCDPLDCSPPGPSVHGILQARMLESVAIPFSRRSSQPRDQTLISGILGGFFTIWAIREALG